MNLKPGSRWRSAVCDGEFVIVRPPHDQADLLCGGEPVTELGAITPAGRAPSAGFDAGAQVGKRYTDAETGVEVLCSKGGKGSLAIGGRLLVLKEAKKLPASD